MGGHQAPRADVGQASSNGDDSLADVVEHLFAVFESRLPLPSIVAVVRRCRGELEITSGPPARRRLEQLAHRRLLALTGTASETPPD